MHKFMIKYNKGAVRFVSLSLLTLAFSSCGLYTKYDHDKAIKKANLENIDQSVMRDASKYANTTSEDSFGDVEWQKVFTDPQLQQLIRQGLERNVDIYAAVANVKKLETALSCARLAFLPSVAFAPSGTLSKVLTGDSKGADWSKKYTMPLNASWTLDIFGNILSQKRAAEMNLEMAKDYEQAARSGIICGVANCYYTLLMLDRQMEILNDMEQLTFDTWNMMKLQKELRGAKETSVVSAQAAYLSVKAQKIDMQRQISEVENSLSVLIGQQPQAIGRGKLADQSLPSEFSTGIAINVLANRPDVHAAEMKMANSFYGVETARSKFYPNISISATGAYSNSLGTKVSNPGALLANFVANLAQPIFQNGKLIAGLKVAKIDYEVALRDWEYSVLNAGAEVSNALVEYNTSKEKGDIERQRVEALTKSVDYTKELFKMGNSSYLEVIQAQSSLLNAEIAQVTDDFNKMQAVVNLYSALGGGRK